MTLIEDYYSYLYSWHPRVFEWKNDISALKHRSSFPISQTELKNYKFYQNNSNNMLQNLTNNLLLVK